MFDYSSACWGRECWHFWIRHQLASGRLDGPVHEGPHLRLGRAPSLALVRGCGHGSLWLAGEREDGWHLNAGRLHVPLSDVLGVGAVSNRLDDQLPDG